MTLKFNKSITNKLLSSKKPFHSATRTQIQWNEGLSDEEGRIPFGTMYRNKILGHHTFFITEKNGISYLIHYSKKNFFIPYVITNLDTFLEMVPCDALDTPDTESILKAIDVVARPELVHGFIEIDNDKLFVFQYN